MRGRIAALLTVFLVICACHRNDAFKAVATVNGEKITLGEFRERLADALRLQEDHASLKPEESRRLREEVLNRMIDEKIMSFRAAELAISVSDDEVTKKIDEMKEGYSQDGFYEILATQGIQYDAWKGALRTRMVMEKLIAFDVGAGISVSEKEVRAHYEAHRKEYTPGMKVHIAQIVLRNQEQAEGALNRLKNGENFGKVARELSLGLEAGRGGDLGFVGRGIMPEAIDAAIFSLRRGAISKVIKSPYGYGYHIIKIMERKEGVKKFSEIKDRVLSDIRKVREEQAYVQWLTHLRSRAIIDIDRDFLKMTAMSNSGQAK